MNQQNQQPEQLEYNVKKWEWSREGDSLVLTQVVETKTKFSQGQAEQALMEWKRQAHQNRQSASEEAQKEFIQEAEKLEEKAQELDEALKPIRNDVKTKHALDAKKKARGKKK